MLKISLMLITLLPSLAHSDCRSECITALNAADKVIADQQVEIDTYKTEVSSLQKSIEIDNQKLVDRDQILAEWYHNPIMIGLLGVLVGGAGAVYLQHR